MARDGSFLVDSRNTWAVYDVDPHSGRVRWQLGGKQSTFKLGPGAATAWQHDAREQPDGAITFFDNGASPRVHPASRAVEVALDPAPGTATLVRSYFHPTPLVAASQGNVQALANGDWMIGWGQAGYLSEVEPSGGCCSTPICPPAGRPIAPTRCPGAAAAGAAEPGAAQGPLRRRGRLRELERGHGRGLLAGAGRRLRRGPGAAGEPPADGLRDQHRPAGDGARRART